MGMVKENDAPVRIELATDEGAAVPVAEDAPRGARPRTVLAGVLVLVLPVVGLVLALRPEDGQTAAGTPIVVPTTVLDDPADAGASADGSTDEERGVATDPDVEDDLLDSATRTPYEQVESDDFILSSVDADLGWIALAFGNEAGGGRLLRSLDGMTWDPLATDDLPDGDVLGLDRFDGVYVIAVDERRSWSSSNFRGSGGAIPEHHIRVFTSLDAINWFPSELPTLEGAGFPFLVSFTADSYVVPIQGAADGSSEALVELLAPFVDAETASRVCESRRDFSDSDRAVLLLDCDGQVLARVIADEHPDDFETIWPEYCVEAAREIGLEEFSLAMVERGGSTQSIEISENPVLFGRAVPGGYLARSGSIGVRELPPECGGPRTTVTGPRTRPVPLIYWDAGTGVSIVTPDEQEPSAGDFGPDGALAKTTDEKIITIVNGTVYGGTRPFDSWQEITGPPDGAGTFDQVSLTPDGRAAGLYSEGTIWITRDFSTWRPFSLAELGAFSARVIVAAEDYVVVSVQGGRAGALVKIPFPA